MDPVGVASRRALTVGLFMGEIRDGNAKEDKGAGQLSLYEKTAREIKVPTQESLSVAMSWSKE